MSLPTSVPLGTTSPRSSYALPMHCPVLAACRCMSLPTSVPLGTTSPLSPTPCLRTSGTDGAYIGIGWDMLVLAGTVVLAEILCAYADDGETHQ
eukprot:986538-Rhodomonas_salina.1